MGQCYKCGKKTQYDLCVNCYKLGFSGDKIKGRIAETIVEELFRFMGYNVVRYGVENTAPEIMHLLRGMRSEEAIQIRSMPDFIVQKDEKVFFLEVKYRANEEFSRENLPADYPYENAYFVVVSKNHIKCITFKELKEGKKISLNSSGNPYYYLGDRKEFELDKEIIIVFCEFAAKLFSNV